MLLCTETHIGDWEVLEVASTLVAYRERTFKSRDRPNAHFQEGGEGQQ